MEGPGWSVKRGLGWGARGEFCTRQNKGNLLYEVKGLCCFLLPLHVSILLEYFQCQT